MPLFEYICRDCELAFEELVSFSNSERGVSCPGCSGVNTEKQLSVFSASVAPSGGDACSPTGCEKPGCPTTAARSPFT